MISDISKRHHYSIAYNRVGLLSHKETEKESIAAIAGGDLTEGSCASAALAYAMRRQGYDVTDFRGSDSREFFSKNAQTLNSDYISARGRNITELFASKGYHNLHIDGVKSISSTRAGDFAAAHEVLGKAEAGKEYLLAAGAHMAVVKKTESGWQYLELQSRSDNGWKSMENPAYKGRKTAVDRVLKYRFGANNSKGYIHQATLIDATSLKGNEMLTLAGYFNAKGMKEHKGANGHER
ncbi:hypothetical protein ACXO4L_03080 [Lactobacillus delbrueckii subsp. bulgaricus]